jgi:PTH1 family peptidyl-tRNA hydrolase
MIGSGMIGSKKITLVKPLTYMNNSGTAVREITESLDINLCQLLVITDDFNLPLGKIRLRKRGSSGGHNGLYSIIYHLSTEEFPRLRCGIGVEPVLEEKSKASDFVLSCFTSNEMKIVQRLVLAAQEVVLTAVTEGFKTASNRYNNIQV